jgi:Asp-tRNA(Asn)/Glu-tRNA(Gln) amidotransferase A subunit family amidase
MELHEMTVCRLKEMIGAKEVSCTEVLDSFIARVRAVDEQTEGYITNTFDMAKEKRKRRTRHWQTGKTSDRSAAFRMP